MTLHVFCYSLFYFFFADFTISCLLSCPLLPLHSNFYHLPRMTKESKFYED